MSKGVMRDVFLERLHRLMEEDGSIFILSADFGSPRLDAIRRDFGDRFINVGIAEQNLVNVAAGLALEGFKVYAYAIAPFLTMRAYEQIRVNLALQGQLKKINVNLIGVGAGLSYDVSGPTHHCLEDLSIMRALPNMAVFSPSDWALAGQLAEYTLRSSGVKYLRFDGKPVERVYGEAADIEAGLGELKKGKGVCLVSTGYMTHTALEASGMLEKEGISAGVIDVFTLSPFDSVGFLKLIRDYSHIFTLEEGFLGKGGLDSLITSAIIDSGAQPKLASFGFDGGYLFCIGDRAALHRLKGIDPVCVAKEIKRSFHGV
ncbi:MAG TPA: transketolase [Deltaproteobacteria bacterium]|nr:MAG: transketolase [Deltaproteobacteria bacterium GWA2_55_82]OIJ73603.1 MAG: transketolase [Deltaproteobacteria bacterium GWC2_55_46]HBG47740.1 transketolase [Deltaproteobacteria bacterium]HCY12038.1 transketolase [Deltaproteobacteria bacterium]